MIHKLINNTYTPLPFEIKWLFFGQGIDEISNSYEKKLKNFIY